jgi:hypothetical protein
VALLVLQQPVPWIEQIGFATDNWRSRAKDLQLRETARWIALWHRRYGIPIRRASSVPTGASSGPA